jgi:superfamily I DNA/RNA helicase
MLHLLLPPPHHPPACFRVGKPKKGQAIIEELRESGAPDFVKLKPEQAVKLTRVYDKYQRQLRWQGLLDFDDLLHHCLALVHNYPDEVRNRAT